MKLWQKNLKHMQTLKKGNQNLTIEAKKFQKEKDFQDSMNYINQLDKRLSETFHLIEADSFASHQIWKEWFYDVPEKDRKFIFVQDHSGRGFEIGRLDKRPVVLSFSWFIVNGHRVGFYCCDSQVSDWDMIEKWIKKYMPHVKHQSNATNAHNVLNYLED